MLCVLFGQYHIIVQNFVVHGFVLRDCPEAVVHTQVLQPLLHGFYSFEAQQQTEPDKLLAAPLFSESPEVASTGAYSEHSNINFFLHDTLIECIATSGMVGTYAIHQSHLFMKSFSDAAEDVQWKFMSEKFARLDPNRSTPHLSLAVGTKEQPISNSAKVHQVSVDIS